MSCLHVKARSCNIPLGVGVNCGERMNVAAEPVTSGLAIAKSIKNGLGVRRRVKNGFSATADCGQRMEVFASIVCTINNGVYYLCVSEGILTVQEGYLRVAENID